MRNTFQYLVIISLLLWTCSCEKDSVRNNGQVTVSSKFNFDDASVYGYNFELGESTRFPAADDPAPDVIVEHYRLLDGSVKPKFTSPSNPFGFALAGEFGELTTSLAFFNDSLLSADPSVTYAPSTDTVRKYQVWVLKSSLERYAKIHVRDIAVVADAAGDHLEVLIDYSYQPDGSTDFPK